MLKLKLILKEDDEEQQLPLAEATESGIEGEIPTREEVDGDRRSVNNQHRD